MIKAIKWRRNFEIFHVGFIFDPFVTGMSVVRIENLKGNFCNIIIIVEIMLPLGEKVDAHFLTDFHYIHSKHDLHINFKILSNLLYWYIYFHLK